MSDSIVQGGYGPLESPVALMGEWVTTGSVKRWVPRTAPELVRPKDVDVHALIACPTCRACVDERCKSAGGNIRTDHADRIIGVRCPCGQTVDKRHRYCSTCREKARRMTYRDREIRRPTRLRRAS